MVTSGSRINDRTQERIKRMKMSAKMPRKLEKSPTRCQPRVIMPRMAKIRSSGKFFNFTSQYYNQLAAVVYADIFNYPLTVKEAKLWAIRKVREKYSQEKFDRAVKIVSYLKLLAPR